MRRKQEQIRQQNLEHLIREAGSIANLARATGINKSYLSQIRNQVLTPIGTRRRVGDELAARLEQGMEKLEGWMDELHDHPIFTADGRQVQGATSIRTMCPLLSWVQAGQWTETLKDTLAPEDIEWYPCPVNCSPRTFVLRVQGISMEPRFREGDMIFIDPEVEAVHGKHVVVLQEGSDETTFKQLVVEGERKFLRALNPNWPEHIIELRSDALVCGVVVFKGEVI